LLTAGPPRFQRHHCRIELANTAEQSNFQAVPKHRPFLYEVVGLRFYARTDFTPQYLARTAPMSKGRQPLRLLLRIQRPSKWLRAKRAC
jgi:hypothetical protein